MYVANWDALPETENLPNNFRVAVAGREMGVNRIRWVHPTVLPHHSHPDAEQCVVVTSGSIELTIGDETQVLKPGDIAVIPRDVTHSGRSIEGGSNLHRGFRPLAHRKLGRLPR